MRVNPLHIVGIYLTVSVYIALGKVGKLIFTANMRINSLHIVGIYLSVFVHIPDEIDGYILGNITVTYRDLLGEWRVALLLHLQGIRSGGNGGEGIGRAVAGDGSGQRCSAGRGSASR